ncbi:unnamed protein product, partial [Symbiodinium sp. CCMP2592]
MVRGPLIAAFFRDTNAQICSLPSAPGGHASPHMHDIPGEGVSPSASGPIDASHSAVAREGLLEEESHEPVQDIEVHVTLFSSKSVCVWASADDTVNKLRLKAQKELLVGLAGLVAPNGELLRGLDTLRQSNLRSGDMVYATVRPATLASTRQSMAFALMRSDGSVVTWGPGDRGGDSSAVQDRLRDVEQIVATGVSFAAIRSDRRVVTWGAPTMGGDSSKVSQQLEDVVAVRGTVHAFAAITGSGDVITWGHIK